MTDGVQVTQGQIPVNCVTRVLRTSDVLILEVDTSSKYAGSSMAGTGPGEAAPAVFLFAGEQTLNANPVDGPTEIMLPASVAGFTIAVEWCRYTVRIIAYRAREDEIMYFSEDRGTPRSAHPGRLRGCGSGRGGKAAPAARPVR